MQPVSHGPHCHVMGRAGPGRDVWKNDGPGRAGQWNFQKFIGWAGSRPILRKFDGPARDSTDPLKIWRAGRGSGLSYQKCVSRAGPVGPAQPNTGPGHQRRPVTSPGMLLFHQKCIWSMMYMHDVFCDLWSFVGWYGTQQYIEIVNIDVGGLIGCCARSTIGRDIDWFQGASWTEIRVV